jgi:hypothetical protein
VVQSNRRAGPHRCQDLLEERAPHGFVDLSDVISQQELDDIALEYKRVAGFDIDGLNGRPSLSVSVGPVWAASGCLRTDKRQRLQQRQILAGSPGCFGRGVAQRLPYGLGAMLESVTLQRGQRHADRNPNGVGGTNDD